MKKFISFIIVYYIAISMFAQDIIVTRKSERIEAQITEVSNTEVKYKEYKYQDGPTFVLRTSDTVDLLNCK